MFRLYTLPFFVIFFVVALVTPSIGNAEGTCCICEFEGYLSPPEKRECYSNVPDNYHCRNIRQQLSSNNPQVICNFYLKACEEDSEVCKKITPFVKTQGGSSKGSAGDCPSGKFCPQVSIPGSVYKADEGVEIVEKVGDSKGGGIIYAATLLPKYIRAVYQFGVWLTILLAIFMMMVGGFIWLTAGGSTERVSSAKSYIGNAFAGLMLALFSYGILFTVNPRTVNLEPIHIETEPAKDIQRHCCLVPDKYSGRTDAEIAIFLPLTANDKKEIKCVEQDTEWKECPAGLQGHSCLCTLTDVDWVLWIDSLNPDDEYVMCAEKVYSTTYGPSISLEQRAALRGEGPITYPESDLLGTINGAEDCRWLENEIAKKNKDFKNISCLYYQYSCLALEKGLLFDRSQDNHFLNVFPSVK